MEFKQKIKNILLRSQKYTQTDMLYLAKGGFWWVLGKSGLLLLSFATMIAFSRWVPKKIFGSYQYILSIIAILAIFTLPGMGKALTRATARGKEKMLILCAKTKFKWSLIGVAISLAIAGWYFIHHNFVLGASFLIAAGFFPLPLIFNLIFNFWQGKKRFDIQSKYLVAINFLEAIVFLPVIFLTNNLIVIILAYFVSRTLFRGLFFKLTLKTAKNQGEDNETLSFGKHLTLMQTVARFGNQLDKIIIWQLLGPIPVAVYSFAQLPLQNIKGFIPIAPLALPKLSQKNIKGIKKGVLGKFLKLFLISAPFALFFFLISPYLYKILFPKYLESIPYFQVLTLTLVFIPFSLLSSALLAAMKTKQLYAIQLIVPILNIALLLILIPLYGIWGAIIAILSTQILQSSLVFYFFKKM